MDRPVVGPPRWGWAKRAGGVPTLGRAPRGKVTGGRRLETSAQQLSGKPNVREGSGKPNGKYRGAP